MSFSFLIFFSVFLQHEHVKRESDVEGVTKAAVVTLFTQPCLPVDGEVRQICSRGSQTLLGGVPPPPTCGSHTLVAKGRVKELTAWEVSAAPLSPPSTSSYPFQLLGWFLIQSPLPRPPPPLLTPRCCPHTSKWLQTLTEQHQSNNPGISSKSLQLTCEAEGWAAQKQDLCLLFLQGPPLSSTSSLNLLGVVGSSARELSVLMCPSSSCLSVCLSGGPAEARKPNWLGRNLEGRSSTSSR